MSITGIISTHKTRLQLMSSSSTTNTDKLADNIRTEIKLKDKTKIKLSEMDQIDVDCASCGYTIKDFTNIVSAACGHGVIHYNCSYFNMECSVCESKLTADDADLQLRPNGINGGENQNMQLQLMQIVRSLNELKMLLNEQKQEQVKTSQVVEELNERLKSRDEKILQLQKEIYELKLEKVEMLKKELQDKLSSLA